MARFIIKHLRDIRPQKTNSTFMHSGSENTEVKTDDTVDADKKDSEPKGESKKPSKRQKNKIQENKSTMGTAEKIAMAQQILDNGENVKVLKSDKGLIERTESSKTILTEDNKELLID